MYIVIEMCVFLRICRVDTVKTADGESNTNPGHPTSLLFTVRTSKHNGVVYDVCFSCTEKNVKSRPPALNIKNVFCFKKNEFSL